MQSDAGLVVTLASTVCENEAEILQDVQVALSQLKDGFEQLMAAANLELSRLHAVAEGVIAEVEAKHKHEAAEKIKETVDRLEAEYEKERQERLAELHELELRVKALNQAATWQKNFAEFNKKVRDLSMCLFATEDILETGKPFLAQWQRLAEYGKNDPVIAAAIDSVPIVLVERGLPTTKALMERWRRVERAAREVAFIPKPSTGGNPSIWAHLVGKVFAVATFPEAELRPGDDDLARLARASYYVNAGQLANAVRELEALQPATKQICADWLEQAKQRMVVAQAVDVIKAHVTTLELSFY